MKKILLIEDRKERQQLFINETDIDLNKYENKYYKNLLKTYNHSNSSLTLDIAEFLQKSQWKNSEFCLSRA